MRPDRHLRREGLTAEGAVVEPMGVLEHA